MLVPSSKVSSKVLAQIGTVPYGEVDDESSMSGDHRFITYLCRRPSGPVQPGSIMVLYLRGG